MKNFWQLTVLAAENQVYLLEELLFLAGAQTVTLGDGGHAPIFEPPLGAHPNWPKTCVQALFCNERSEQTILSDLAVYFQRTNLLIPLPESLELLPNQDWVRFTLDQFIPMQIGCFWVKPSWSNDMTPPGLTTLMLDPGLAFGTGMHPTTQLCLEWLSDHPTTQQSVIDFGCGSGILGIAAGCLGATSVFGLDIDPQALVATKHNASLNALKIEAITAGQIPDQTFDVVVANILANPLIQLSANLTNLLKPTGSLVLAGLLDEQATQVREAYPSIQFDTDESKDGWTRLSGTLV